MTDNAVTGTDWRDDELDAIVQDYFAMLADELAGRPYVKKRRREALMQRIGRSASSIEFKHMNISAVLEKLGASWISGYKPAAHAQEGAIIDAIDRYLTRDPGILQRPAAETQPSLPVSSIFVAPPAPLERTAPVGQRLARLVRKFDPVDRDHRNRSLGRAGEKFVFDIECQHLLRQERPDLARRVRWVAAEDGDGAGYDVLSFRPDGREKLIEVKTTNGGPRTPFFMTRNELDVSREAPDRWRLYRVHEFAQAPKVFSLRPPLEATALLAPETWKVSLR